MPTPDDVREYQRRVARGEAGVPPDVQTQARSGDKRAIRDESAILDQNQRNAEAAQRDAERQQADMQKEAARQAKEQEKLAEDQRKMQLRMAEDQGIRTETDVVSGDKRIVTHPETGQPVYEPGAVGEPYQTPEGQWSQRFRDASGAQTEMPMASVPGGTKVDAKTGDRYFERDNELGQKVREVVGRDENTVRKLQFDRQSKRLDLVESAVSQQKLKLEPRFKPVKDTYDDAKARLDKLNASKRFYRNGQGAWVEYTNGVEIPVDPATNARFTSWRRETTQAQQQLAEASKSYEKLRPAWESVENAERELKLKRVDLENKRLASELGVEAGKDNVTARLAATNAGVDQTPQDVAGVAALTGAPPAPEGKPPQMPEVQMPPGFTKFPGHFPKVKNADGTESNVMLGTFEIDGKHYVIPTMASGKQLDPDTAVIHAQRQGLDKYPSFATPEEAEAFAQRYHGNVREDGLVLTDSEIETTLGQRVGDFDDDAAKALAVKAFSGIKGAEDMTVEKVSNDTYFLKRDGRTVADVSLDANRNPYIEIPSHIGTSDLLGIAMAGVESGIPVYLRPDKTGKRMDQVEEARWAGEALRTGMRPPETEGMTSGEWKAYSVERARMLEGQGLGLGEIARKAAQGEISIQTGQTLAANLWGNDLKPDDYRDKAVLAQWLEDTSVMQMKAGVPADQTAAALWEKRDSDPTAAQGVWRQYAGEWYRRNSWLPGMTRDMAIDAIKASPVRGLTAAEKLGDITNEVGASVLSAMAGLFYGLGRDALAIPASAISGKARKALSENTELRNRQFKNFTLGFKQKMAIWATPEGQEAATNFDRSLGALRRTAAVEFASRASDPPRMDEVRSAITRMTDAALGIHNLSQEDGWEMTREDLDPNKNKELGATLLDYFETGDPVYLDRYREMLLTKKGMAQANAILAEKTKGHGTWASAFITGAYAGWEEVLTEVASDVLIAGMGKMARVGLKVGEEVGASAAKQMAKSAFRGSESLGKAATRVSRMRGSTQRLMSEWAHMGLMADNLAHPLGRAGRTWNRAMTYVVKPAVAAVPVEAAEEYPTEMGQNPEWSGAAEMKAALIGGLGGFAAGPVISGVANAPLSAINMARAKAASRTVDADFVDIYNDTMAGVEGFVPISAKDAGIARAMLGTMDHAGMEQLANTAAIAMQEKNIAALEANDALQKALDVGIAENVDEARKTYESAVADFDAAKADWMDAVGNMTSSAGNVVEAVSEVSKIEDPGERAKWMGIAKVATGVPETLTGSESQAIGGLVTQDGHPYFTEDNQFTAEGRAETMMTMPTVGRLIQTDESQTIVDEAIAAQAGEQATPDEPAPAEPAKGEEAPELQPEAKRSPDLIPEWMPPNLSVVKGSDGNALIVNDTTGETVWEGPEGDVPKEMASIRSEVFSANAVANRAKQRFEQQVPGIRGKIKIVTGQEEGAPVAGARAMSDGTIELHIPALDQELAQYAPENRDTKMENTMIEEIIHAAQFEAIRRSGATTDAVYGQIWSEMTDDQQRAARDAYGPEAFDRLDDTQKAMETARMVLDMRRRGKINELTRTIAKNPPKTLIELLKQALVVLKQMATGDMPASLRKAIDEFEAVLTEFEAVAGQRSKREAKQMESKVGGSGAVIPKGPKTTVTTPGQERTVQVTETAVDMSQIVASSDKGYPGGAMQPRDRKSSVSAEQRAEMVANLKNNPDQWKRYWSAPTTDNGRIVVAPLYRDGAAVKNAQGQQMFYVISGNGRTMALRDAVKSHGNETFSKAVSAALDKQGVSTEGMNHPVPVAVYEPKSAADAIELAELSNRTAQMSVSNVEQAQRDARAIETGNLMGLWTPDDSGNVGAASNRDFVRAFARAVGDDSVIDPATGRPTDEGAKRIERAMVAQLVGIDDTARPVLTKLFNQSGQLGLRRLVQGVAAEAGSLVALAEAKPEFDIIPVLATALGDAIDAKQAVADGQFKTTGDYFDQTEFDFARGAQQSQSEQAFSRALLDAKSAKAVRDILRAYQDAAANVDTTTGNLFGEPLPTRDELLDIATGRQTNDRRPEPKEKRAPDTEEKGDQTPDVQGAEQVPGPDETGTVPQEPAPEEVMPEGVTPDVAEINRLADEINKKLERGSSRHGPESVVLHGQLGDAIEPGLRLGDKQVVGESYAAFRRGDITADEFDRILGEQRNQIPSLRGTEPNFQASKLAPEKPQAEEGTFAIGDTIWHAGRQVTITSEPYELHGGEFQDAVYDQGGTVTIATPRQVKANIERNRQIKRDQEAAMKRVAKMQKEEAEKAEAPKKKAPRKPRRTSQQIKEDKARAAAKKLSDRLKKFEQGLEAAPTADFSKSIPRQISRDLLDFAESGIEAGIVAPGDLASFIDDATDGHLRPYSGAIWKMFQSVDMDLPDVPDWSPIYAALDAEEAPPAEPQAEELDAAAETTDTAPRDERDTRPGTGGGGGGEAWLPGLEGADDAGGGSGDQAAGGQPSSEGLPAEPHESGQPAGGESAGQRPGKRSRPQRGGGQRNGQQDTGDAGPGTAEHGVATGDGGPAGRTRGPSSRPPVSAPTDDASGAGTDNLPPEVETPANPEDRNTRIDPSETLAPRGLKSKARANLDAIDLVKKLEAEGRNPTAAERETLLKYTGWGALKGVFDDRKANAGDVNWAKTWKSLRDELQASLTEKEFNEAARSVLNAHFSTPEVLGGMWTMLERLGFRGGNVMDPSAGTGHCIGTQPEHLAARSKWYASELDTTTAKILSKLYPQASVNNSAPNAARVIDGVGFQDIRVPNNSLDLLFTNVPFHKRGPWQSKKEHGIDLNLHNYFFARALDKVKPGGLVAFITTAHTMESQRAQREFIASKGDLIAAVRLPNNAFKENAGTEVVTDILILRKPDGRDVQSHPWVERKVVGTSKATFSHADNVPVLQHYGTDIQWEDPELARAVAVIEEVQNREVTGDAEKQRRKEDLAAAEDEYLATYDKKMKGGRKIVARVKVYANEYFDANPTHVIGNHSLEGSMYGPNEYTVMPDGADLGNALEDIAKTLPENISGWTPGSATAKLSVFDEKEVAPFSFAYDSATGEYYQNTVGPEGYIEKTPVEWNDQQKRVFRSWTRLRDVYRNLIALEQDDTATDEDVEKARVRLNQVYDGHVNLDRKGPTKSGKPRISPNPVGPTSRTGSGAPHNFLKDDPDYSLVASLEDQEKVLDPETGKETTIYHKAGVFSRRVNRALVPPDSAESVEDGLLQSMAWLGNVNPDYIAKLMGREGEGEAVASEIIGKGIAFLDPKTGRLVERDEYLSGHVKGKLDSAEEAVKDDPRFASNVEALRDALPERTLIPKIVLQISSRWIPTEVLETFATSQLGFESVNIDYNPVTANFHIRGEDENSTFRTPHKAPTKLLDHALEGTYPNIRIKDEPEESIEATEQAKVIIDRIKNDFIRWAKTTDDTIDGRAVPDLLEDEFNDKVNGHVPFEPKGDYVTLPGATDTVYRTPIRRQAIARMLQQGHGTIAHGVGFGKTFTIIATAMEMKRLGKAKKPMIVVQNSTLDQFAASFRQAYPGARLLVATKESVSPLKRRQFFARVATGDFDAVVIPQSQFDRIPNDPEIVKAWVNEKLSEMRQELGISEDADDSGKRRVSQDQDTLIKLENALAKVLDAHKKHQDYGLHWEDLGIDALFVDEAHEYKNVPVVTKMKMKNIPNGEASQKAVGMTLKAGSIQATHGGKGVFFATGTPITNSMAEAYIMLNLTSPHILKEQGIENFDDFANNYGAPVTNIEPTWKGNLESITRFAKFINGPQLIRLIKSSWDVQMDPDKAGLKLPKVKGGSPELKIVPPSPTMEIYNQWVVQRIADMWQNMPNRRETLKENPQWQAVPIVTMQAGIAAALDPRLIDPSATDHEGSKINVAIGEIARIHKDTSAYRGTQAVFIDTMNEFDVGVLADFAGEPNLSKEGLRLRETTNDKGNRQVKVVKKGFDLYKDVVDKLVAQGIPRKEIAVIRSTMGSTQRTKVFDRVNSGEIRVVIGSTDTMGVGVNMQERMAALHNMSPPRSMKPAFMEQRIGRALRQGNLHYAMGIEAYVRVVENATGQKFRKTDGTPDYNAAVEATAENEALRAEAEAAEDKFAIEIINYGVERSLDAAIYSLMATKQKFITQAISGDIPGIEFEDAADEIQMSLAEMAARTIGDPLQIKRVELTRDIKALERESDAYVAIQSQNMMRARNAKARADRLSKAMPFFEKAQETFRDAEKITPAEWSYNGKPFEEGKVIEGLNRMLATEIGKIPVDTFSDPFSVTKNGITYDVAVPHDMSDIGTGVVRMGVVGVRGDKTSTNRGITSARSLESAIRSLEKHYRNIVDTSKKDIAESRKAAEDASKAAKEVFPGDEKLTMLKLDFADLEDQIREQAESDRRARERERANEQSAEAAPTGAEPNRIKAVLASLPPIFADVYEAAMTTPSGSLAIEEVARKTKQKPVTVGNILNIIKARLESTHQMDEGGLVLRKDKETGKIVGGRPDLALGAVPEFAAIDQTRNEAGVPDLRTHAVVNEEATKMLFDDYEGTFAAIEKKAQAMQPFTDVEIAAAQKIIAKEMANGRDATDDQKMRLALLIHGYRDIGTATARALAMRRDYAMTPAERNLQFIGEALYTPDPETRAFIRDMEHDEAAKKAAIRKWVERVDGLKARLMMHGIDIDASLAGFKEMMTEFKSARKRAPEAAKALDIEVAKLNSLERYIITALQGKAIPVPRVALAAGTTSAKIVEIYKKFYTRLHSAVSGFAKKYLKASLESAPTDALATQVLRDLGFVPPDELLMTEPAPAPSPDHPTTQTRRRGTRRKTKTRPGKGPTVHPVPPKMATGGLFDPRDPLAMKKVMDVLAYERSTTLDKVLEYWRASILSGPQTQSVNVFSGLLFGVYEALPKKFVEAGINGMLGIAGAKQKDAATFGEFKAMFNAAHDAITTAGRNMVRSWRMENRLYHDFARGEASMVDFSNVNDKYIPPAMKSKLGRVMRNISFRPMTAADEFVKSFFGKLEWAAQAHRIAKSEGLSGATYDARFAELMKQGSLAAIKSIEHVDRLTFQTPIGRQKTKIKVMADNSFAEIHEEGPTRAIDSLDPIVDAVKKIRTGRGKMMTFVVPFIDTPYNIMKVGIEISPIGAFFALADAARALKIRINRRSISPEMARAEAAKLYDAARAVRDLANQLIAYGTLYALAEMTKPSDDDDDPYKGLPHITGTVPYKGTRRGTRDLAYRTMGPTTLRIGSTFLNYGRIEPIATMLALVADTINAYRTSPTNTAFFAKSFGTAEGMIQDKTFLRGSADFLNLIQDPERYGPQWASNIATGFAPNFVRQPIRVADKNVREYTLPPSAEGQEPQFFESVARRVARNVIPTRKPVKIDVWGRDVTYGRDSQFGPVSNYLLRLFSPMMVLKSPKVDSLDVFIREYNDTTNDPKKKIAVEPIRRAATYKRNGKNYRLVLTDDELEDVNRQAGKQARKALGEGWQDRKPNDADAKRIKNTVQAVQRAARQRYFGRKLAEAVRLERTAR